MLPARRAMRAAALPSPAREVAPTNSGRTGPGLRVPWGPVALEDPARGRPALVWVRRPARAACIPFHLSRYEWLQRPVPGALGIPPIQRVASHAHGSSGCYGSPPLEPSHNADSHPNTVPSHPVWFSPAQRQDPERHAPQAKFFLSCAQWILRRFARVFPSLINGARCETLRG
ncbi:hypothetical protein PCL_02962 [Purpureocillium lilacinum]|uniref:Uncharacterized protein n=1 Tax=Purpureocillium lilacinum TaxID=33203 RepID=A0A2U3DZC4_PURLI|nr:hypothetical protein PCL_02962 [Purpureocillium lilacinum]